MTKNTFTEKTLNTEILSRKKFVIMNKITINTFREKRLNTEILNNKKFLIMNKIRKIHSEKNNLIMRFCLIKSF